MSLEIFQQLAEPIDPARIKERKQGGATIRYIDARTVIDRLNTVCPGMWTFETELLAMPQGDKSKWVFKGRLTVCGAWQEDVGMNDNDDYFDPPKSAVSDALKRCAVHFGIGAELYGDAPKQSKSTGNGQPPQKAPEPPKQAQAASSKWPPRPWEPETLQAAMLASIVNKSTDRVSKDKARQLAIKWKNITSQKDDIRHLAASYIFKAHITTFEQLSEAAAEALTDWLTGHPPLARQEAQLLAELVNSRVSAQEPLFDTEEAA